ncbi:MAG: S41 family peptidase [Candidatus Aminicenantes bacterium]|nr:S41 family peptidase [Candidatus Aminicenantes bacterium]
MTRNVLKNRILVLSLLFLLLSGAVFAQRVEAAQNDVTLDAEMKAFVVGRVCRMLVSQYIFPETAKKMEDHLTAQLKQGKYDSVNDVNEFARVLTVDLRSISGDKHLRVTCSPETVRRMRAGSSRSKEERERERTASIDRERRRNYGFRRLEILEGNVGYLDLTGFSGLDEAGETIVAAMNFLANSDAVIIDLRQNGGGSPFTIQIISSYFLKNYTHLNSFEWRGADTLRQFWTLPFVPGKMMYDTDLYILTSSRTFSAAEEFTYNLKNLKRATIVGETTGGGAHPGGNRIVNDYFLVWIPSGRAINPITKTNWEGTGIEPHIKVDQVQALDKAHLTALEKLQKKSADEEQTFGLKWAMDGLKAELEPFEVKEEILHRYTGKYTRGEVVLENGQLVLQAGTRPFKMIPLTENYFVLDGWDAVRIEFVPDEGAGDYIIKTHMSDGTIEIIKKMK